MFVLRAEHLTFTYDDKNLALNDVSFEIPEQSIFAVLGPNGSGKTTLFNLMLGLLTPTEGNLHTLGGRPDDRLNKRHIGWVPSELSQSMMLTLEEYFALLASTQPDFDPTFARDLLEPFDLVGAERKLAGALSHGMRKKAQLIGAMAHRPRVLLLDEPFSGLDPQSQHILEAALRELRRLGTTIIISSHQIEVVHYLATDLAILDNGCVRAAGKPADLLASHGVSSLRELYLAATGVAVETAERTEKLRQMLDRTLVRQVTV